MRRMLPRVRRQSRRGEPDDVRPDLAPMIDIVFNLLVFFMCATKLRTVEGFIRAYLPKDRGLAGGAATVRLDDVRVKLLWHDAHGRPAEGADGHVVLAVGAHHLNAPGDLDGPRAAHHPAWRELHARLLELQAATADGALPVILDARPQVPTKHVVSALNEVVRAGLSDVTFTAPERS
ncbi:MAG: biopolymer transporter ExbD [Planctomycetes bacterium]|nr:biopolymer transporter ExbD [Planctomycetota bacterium]